jgi:hypothetical protein
MFKKFIMAAMLAVSVPTSAQSMGDYEKSVLCPSITSLAGTIMEARQMGMKKEVVISVVSKNTSVTELVMSIIDLAYLTPAYYTVDKQQAAIFAFRNQVEGICYNS